MRTNEHVQLDHRKAVLNLSLGYILLIPGILFSGLVITVNSWAQAFRRGGFLNYDISAKSTEYLCSDPPTLKCHATLSAAIGRVRSYFGNELSDRDSRDNKSGLVIVILLVGVALAAGILTTTLIIWLVAGWRRAPFRPPPNSANVRGSCTERRPSPLTGDGRRDNEAVPAVEDAPAVWRSSTKPLEAGHHASFEPFWHFRS